MTTTAPVPSTSAPFAPEAPCAHCGLPVGRRPTVRGGAGFCCTGCAVVSAALHEAGWAEPFYGRRALGRTRPAARPQEVDPLQSAELDTERFLQEHTSAVGEGGRRRCELFVDGVHCAACVWLVERLPYEVDGVAAARLDLPRARLALDFDPERVRLSAVAAWLARFGYAARPARTAALGQRTDAERRLLIRVGVAWALAGNVMLVAFALYSGLDGDGGPLETAARWASLVLAAPAVLWAGRPFFQRAWQSVRLAWRARDARRLHMDTPIAIGLAVGLGHSAWATVTGQGEVWFDSVAVLTAALLTARFLQLRSRRLAGEASERLLALVPTMARRVASDGTVEVVRQDALRTGDVVDVPPGEVVPVDGRIESGETRLDNGVLTGEARPVPVRPGDAVSAGATNLQAALRVRVDAAGDATRVGRLLAWVREDAGGRAPAALVADRLAGYFVLAVVGLAALPAALWAWLDPAAAPQHVAALLVVTCPCALGMATPLAMAVAAGRAARVGLFVKSDQATERLTQISAVVLDKTGTLTEGRMAVAGWAGDEDALALAAAAERPSSHPIAAAFRLACPDAADREVTAFAAHERGVRATVDGRKVEAEQPGEGLGAPWAGAVRQAVADGHTPVVVRVDGAVRGVAAVGDRVRPDAAALVARLRAGGASVHLLSGDHPDVVRVVAEQLGVEHARGAVSPEDKRAAVAALQRGGRTVLMVGDGVNDAAALRQADVGVAVGGGTTASLVAADVFLTRPGLAPIVALLDGAASAMRTVRRALALSLVYNAVAAGAAVAGLVTPLGAAVAMPLSSLAVVGLALAQPRLRVPAEGDAVPAGDDRSAPGTCPPDLPAAPPFGPRPRPAAAR